MTGVDWGRGTLVNKGVVGEGGGLGQYWEVRWLSPRP